MKTGKEKLAFIGLCAGMMAFGEETKIGRTVAEIDCTREYPTNLYFECGKVVVTNSSAGVYREADPTPDSRFGYRFTVKRVGKPHLAIVRYPDDKTRCMSVSDGTCYDLSIGVFTGTAKPHDHDTGLAQPITGKMQEIRQVFWPRWKDCTIAFGNTTSGEPAAAAHVTICEVKGLPALDVPDASAAGPRRSLGISYEDPCSHSSDLGALTFDMWLDRMVAFAKYEGMNRLTYPVIWYHGPLYPSPTEPANYFDWSVASPVNRNLYIRWTTHPEDWVEKLLTRFDKEHLEFVSQVTYIRLGSLMEKMNIDLGAIKAGADTINNMRSDDKVQSGAGDWTGQYNVRNFERQREAQEREGKGWNQCSLQHGEVPNGGGAGGPIFNPVHPVVQEALLRSIREIATRYGKHPSYKGLNIFCYGSSTLGFGSIRNGYDDTTIRLFERETGIKVPVDGKLPDRFSKRYAFLTSKDLRDKWIAWRCAKITDLIRRMRDELVRVRPDLRLDLSPNGGRDAGIDVGALQKEPGIAITAGMDALGPCASSVMPDSATCRNVNIFNTWIERWGKHAWWACAPDDAQVRELAVIMGKPAEGICRMGSKYAPDGFWWPEAQLRITPAFSGGDHFMRHYANAVARFDPLTLSRGGLTLDRGHADLLRPFALAFRALPAQKFATVGEDTDPVTVRTLISGDKRYVYLVNREYYPSEISVSLTNATGKIVNLSDNSKQSATPTWNLKLGAYELQSFALAPEVGIAGFTVKLPTDIIAQLARDAETVWEKIKAKQSAGEKLPADTNGLATAIQNALKKNQWAALRQLLENSQH
jgi:hypothetical protein